MDQPTLSLRAITHLPFLPAGRLSMDMSTLSAALDYPAIRGSIPAVFDMLIQHIEEVTKRIEDSVPGAIDELAAVCKPATCDVEFRVTRSTIDQLKSLVVALEVGLEAVGKAGRHITR
jgi:hypothetical protein